MRTPQVGVGTHLYVKVGRRAATLKPSGTDVALPDVAIPFAGQPLATLKCGNAKLSQCTEGCENLALQPLDALRKLCIAALQGSKRLPGKRHCHVRQSHVCARGLEWSRTATNLDIEMGARPNQQAC